MRAPPSKDRVASALERESARLCAPVALTTSTIFCAAVLYDLLLHGPRMGPYVIPWLASGIFLAVAGLWMRRRPPHEGHAVLAGIALLGVVNATNYLIVARDPLYTTVLLLAVLGHAILAIHAGWHIVVASPALVAWIAIVATDPYPGDWVTMGLLLAAGVGVGGLAQILRVQDRTRLEGARLDALEGVARMEALSEAAFEGVALHDRGTIILVNPAFARMLGYHASELHGIHALELIAPESRAVVEARLATPDDAPYEVVLLRKDGSRFHGEIAARDFPYDGRTVRVTTVRDVTERDAAAAAARERDRLKTLHDLRARFINDAAHQLNTPITPIKLSAHLLGSGALGPVTPRQSSAITTISRNAEQLAILAKMLLDSTQADDAPLRKDATTDLEAPIQDALHAHADRAHRIGAHVVVQPIPALLVRADGARLAQALRGLVGELLDAAQPGTVVGVAVRAEGGAAEVTLRREPPPGSTEPPGLTDEREHLYVDLARRLVASHGGTLQARVVGASREYALALPLATGPVPSSGPTST